MGRTSWVWCQRRSWECLLTILFSVFSLFQTPVPMETATRSAISKSWQCRVLKYTQAPSSRRCLCSTPSPAMWLCFYRRKRTYCLSLDFLPASMYGSLVETGSESNEEPNFARDVEMSSRRSSRLCSLLRHLEFQIQKNDPDYILFIPRKQGTDQSSKAPRPMKLSSKTIVIERLIFYEGRVESRRDGLCGVERLLLTCLWFLTDVMLWLMKWWAMKSRKKSRDKERETRCKGWEMFTEISSRSEIPPPCCSGTAKKRHKSMCMSAEQSR